jgi:hypothetical protein
MNSSCKALIILVPNPGLVATPFFKSMIGLTQALVRQKIPFAIKTFEFSDIVMSRNFLMSYFLSNPQFSHALCLDCDLQFEASQFFRLLDLQVDCAIAPYPRRQLSMSRLVAGIEKNLAAAPDTRLTEAQVFAQALGHVVQARTSNGDWRSKTQGDFVTVPSAGMGFTLLTRKVPEMMVDAGLVDHFPEQGKLPLHAGADRFHGFFNHIVSPDGKFILGEDQSFFQRWSFGCKGDIWADRRSQIVHHGNYGFRGDFSVEDI